MLTYKNSGLTKIKNGSAAATAMVLSLLLPNQIPAVYAALAVLFAIVVVKHSFGGLGSNWLNPALGGWLFVRFSWPGAFTRALEGVSYSTAERFAEVSALDNSVTSFLNLHVFQFFGAQLPSGYVDMLFSKNSGLITDRGLFALILGTVLISAFAISRRWIPVLFLVVFGFLTRIAGDEAGVLGNGDILMGFFSGGTIAAAFIIAAEPVSGAKLKAGVFVAVVLGAVLSWVFRYRCFEYSGCFIALALVNCLTPLIRLFEENLFLSRESRGLFS
jgi:electron transport complex protein RnfD